MKQFLFIIFFVSAIAMPSFIFCQPVKIYEGFYQATYSGEEKTNIWFKDSTIIYEYAGYFSASVNDSVTIPSQYLPYKYIYFDLKSMKCQDYYSFTDTASIMANYRVLSDDTLIMNFQYKKDKRNNNPMCNELIIMADTVMEGKLYKRKKCSMRFAEPLIEFDYIYYFDYNGKYSDLFLYYSDTLNNFPVCHISRIDINSIFPKAPVFTSRTEFVRSKLTADERRIFQIWEKNSRITSLPETPYKEVRKRPLLPIKYKDYSALEYLKN